MAQPEPHPFGEEKMSARVCPICCDQFKAPRVLPCCHTFCTGCLEKSLKESEEPAELPCSLCRTTHKVPSGGVEGFLEDCSVSYAAEESSDIQQSYPSCQYCDSEDDPVSYCSTCSTYLCNFCSQVHRRQIKRYKDHQLNQLRKITATTKYICDKHSEPLKVFCQTCYSLVCCECIVQSHQKHVYKSVNSETRAGVDKVVGELVETAQGKAKDLKGKIDYMNLVEKAVIERTERLKKEVDSAYQDLLSELDRSRAKIVDEIERAGDKDLKFIWADKNSAELKSKSLNTALELAARAKKCTDIEMLRLSGQLIKTMEEFGNSLFHVEKIEHVHCTSYTLQKQRVTIVLGSITTEVEEVTTEYSKHIADRLESVPLGSRCSFHVQFLPEDPLGYRYPTITQSDVAITYGQSHQKLSTEKIVVEKQDRLAWKVTFVPVCAGKHNVAVLPDDSDTEPVMSKQGKAEGEPIEDESEPVEAEPKSVDFSFDVYGRPPFNSLVRRGPDWDSNYKAGTLDSADGGEGNTGTIRNCFSSASKEMVVVDWEGGKHGHMCRWGSNGRYDVELVGGFYIIMRRLKNI